MGTHARCASNCASVALPTWKRVKRRARRPGHERAPSNKTCASLRTCARLRLGGSAFGPWRGLGHIRRCMAGVRSRIGGRRREANANGLQRNRNGDRPLLGNRGRLPGLSTSLVRTDGLAAQRLRQGEALRNVWAVRCRSWRTRFDAERFVLVETRDVPGPLAPSWLQRWPATRLSGMLRSTGKASTWATNTTRYRRRRMSNQRRGPDGIRVFLGLGLGSSVAVSAIALPPAPVGVPRPTQPRQSPRSMGPQRRQCRAWNAWRGDAWHTRGTAAGRAYHAAGPGDPDDSPANASGFAPTPSRREGLRRAAHADAKRDPPRRTDWDCDAATHRLLRRTHGPSLCRRWHSGL